MKSERRTTNTRRKQSISGQNVIEYILLWVAIIVVLVAILKPGGFMSWRLYNAMERSVDTIDAMVNKIEFDPEYINTWRPCTPGPDCIYQ